MKTFETPDCISPETGLSICKHPELCVCASVNSQKSLYDANKLLEDVMKEDKKYPTFETRLVPISEHPLTEGKTLVVDKYFEDGFPVKARYLPTVKGKMRWISNLRTGCYYQISPTHFLQFKIEAPDGTYKWTHEFKLTEEIK